VGLYEGFCIVKRPGAGDVRGTWDVRGRETYLEALMEKKLKFRSGLEDIDISERIILK
jgi:hypothetical protein